MTQGAFFAVWLAQVYRVGPVEVEHLGHSLLGIGRSAIGLSLPVLFTIHLHKCKMQSSARTKFCKRICASYTLAQVYKRV